MLFKFTKSDILVMIAISLPKLVAGIITSVVIPIFPSLIWVYFSNPLENANSTMMVPKNHSSYNYQYLSILFVVKHICQIVCSPIAGWLIDITGPLILIVAGAILQVLTILTYGIGNSYYLLVIGRILDGISSVVVTCATGAFIAYKYCHDNQRGFLYGLKGLCLAIGTAIGPAYGGAIFEHFGKAWAFLTILIFIAVEMGFVVWLFIRERDFNKPQKLEIELECKKVEIESEPQIHTPNIIKEKYQSSILSILKDPYFLISIGPFFVLYFIIPLLHSALAQYMVIQFYSSETQQGLIWILSFFGFILGFLFGNVINSKYSKHRHLILMGHTFLNALAIIMIPYLPLWWILCIPICVTAYVNILVEVIISPILVAIVETKHNGKFGIMSGIIMMIISITGTLGSYLGPIFLSISAFPYMCISICLLNVFYAPLFLYLKRFC